MDWRHVDYGNRVCLVDLDLFRKEAGMITEKDIENWFTYHEPDKTQINSYATIRDNAKYLALVILKHTPPSADQTAAIRKLRECVMTANAAIACGE